MKKPKTKTEVIHFVKKPTEKELLSELKNFPKGYAFLYKDNLGDFQLRYKPTNNADYEFVRKVVKP